MPAATKEIRRLFEAAADLAIAEVERLARRIMRDNPEVTAYCMANGSATFDTTDEENLGTDELECASELDAFLDEWNETFGLTGYPMWIRGADGPVSNHWTITE